VSVCARVCVCGSVCLCVSVSEDSFLPSSSSKFKCACCVLCVSEPAWVSGQGMHRPSNQKVVDSIPSCGHFGVVGVSLSKKLYSHCSSSPSCINGPGTGVTREAPHPAVTSMGTW